MYYIIIYAVSYRLSKQHNTQEYITILLGTSRYLRVWEKSTVYLLGQEAQVDLYLSFEKSSWKNQVSRTGIPKSILKGYTGSKIHLEID